MKNHLKFEDHHMKIPLHFRVYADSECISQPQNDPKVLYKHIPIAVVYYLLAPFGNQYYSYFGEMCVKWFVNENLTPEKIANNYFKTNMLLQITSRRIIVPTIRRVLVMRRAFLTKHR